MSTVKRGYAHLLSFRYHFALDLQIGRAQSIAKLGGEHEKSSEPSVYEPTDSGGEDEQEGPLRSPLRRKNSGPESVAQYQEAWQSGLLLRSLKPPD